MSRLNAAPTPLAMSVVSLVFLCGLMSCGDPGLSEEFPSMDDSAEVYDVTESEYEESVQLARSLLSSGRAPQTLNYRIMGSVDSSDFIDANFALGPAVPSYEWEGRVWVRSDWDLYPVFHHGELCGVLIRYLGDTDGLYGLDYDLAVPALMPELQEALAGGASLAYARDAEGDWIVMSDGKWHEVRLDGEAVDALYPIEHRAEDNPSQPIERSVATDGLSFSSQGEPVSFVLDADA